MGCPGERSLSGWSTPVAGRETGNQSAHCSQDRKRQKHRCGPTHPESAGPESQGGLRNDNAGVRPLTAVTPVQAPRAVRRRGIVDVAVGSLASPQGAAVAVEQQVAILNEKDEGEAHGHSQARESSQQRSPREHPSGPCGLDTAPHSVSRTVDADQSPPSALRTKAGRSVVIPSTPTSRSRRADASEFTVYTNNFLSIAWRDPNSSGTHNPS